VTLAITIAIIVFALIGVPLFVLFGGAALALFLSLPEGAWASPAIDVFSANFAESPSLMTIPLFTFAGFLLAESGTPIRLIELSRAWLGWMPGGLAIVCLMASTFFATFTGGSGVTIVAVGGLLYPALIREKYPDSFSIGLITTAGAMGGLFPPSVLLIFYGIVAGLVIDKVLLAGIFAGFLTTFALMGYCAYVGIKAKIPRQRFVIREAMRTLWIAKWEVAIPIVLVGGLVTGLLRFHEASAFTAVYVLVVEVFIYRDISIRKDLPRVIIESMTMLGAVLAILITAVGFTGWMIQAEIPTLLFDMMDEHIKSQMAFLIALNIFLVLIGMFTDGITAIIVVVPLVLPLAYAYKVDPYHLAVIFLLNLELGFLIPPVGMNLFISSIRFGKSVAYVCRSVLPSLGVLSVTLVIVTYVPWISTYLPSFIKIEEEGVSLGGGYIRLNESDGGTEEGAAGSEAEQDMAADGINDSFLDGGVDGGADAGAGDGVAGAAGLGGATADEPGGAEPAPAPDEKPQPTKATPASKPRAKPRVQKRSGSE
jgi:tripartite ATP-independent transporter DctM subunit